MSWDSQSTKEARCEISLTKLLIPEVVRTLMARGVVDLSRSTGGYLAYAVGLHGHQSSFWKILHGISLRWPLPMEQEHLQSDPHLLVRRTAHCTELSAVPRGSQ